MASPPGRDRLGGDPASHQRLCSQLRRSKTDRADARLFARFCRREELSEWQPPEPEQEALQKMSHGLEWLKTERGKAKMVIVGAAMRKLLHICYGVLKNELPFDASLHPGVT